ncbi:MAG: hypothetical protein E7318_06385 [Clostridiales bacterium]|nr:hypothetical protein [Clostridiales bacterium]
MSDSKHFRSEEARRNYEKAERQRAQAKQRKALDAKKDEVAGKVKTWLKANTKLALTAAAAIVAVIVAASLLAGVLNAPLRDKQDNWVIIDTSASGKEHRYEHLADFNIPAGYTRDSYSLYKDGVQQDFFCIADDASAPVQDVYVTGAKGIAAVDYPATILAYGLHKEAGEPRTLTIGGQECTALYLVSDESAYYGEGNAIAHMSFYFDAGNACVSATFRSGTVPYEQVPDEATMLAEAEEVLQNLTIIK